MPAEELIRTNGVHCKSFVILYSLSLVLYKRMHKFIKFEHLHPNPSFRRGPNKHILPEKWFWRQIKTQFSISQFANKLSVGLTLFPILEKQKMIGGTNVILNGLEVDQSVLMEGLSLKLLTKCFQMLNQNFVTVSLNDRADIFLRFFYIPYTNLFGCKIIYVQHSSYCDALSGSCQP